MPDFMSVSSGVATGSLLFAATSYLTMWLHLSYFQLYYSQCDFISYNCNFISHNCDYFFCSFSHYLSQSDYFLQLQFKLHFTQCDFLTIATLFLVTVTIGHIFNFISYNDFISYTTASSFLITDYLSHFQLYFTQCDHFLQLQGFLLTSHNVILFFLFLILTNSRSCNFVFHHCDYLTMWLILYLQLISQSWFIF